MRARLLVGLTVLTLVGVATYTGLAGGRTRGAAVNRVGQSASRPTTPVVTANVPAGWHITSRPITSVARPVQRLVVTSFVLHQSRPDPGCGPTTAIREMPRTGAFLFLFEYSGVSRQEIATFPPRPANFRLDPSSYRPYECEGLSYLVRFRDAGREFQAQIYVGSHATSKTRRLLLGVLDSLRVR